MTQEELAEQARVPVQFLGKVLQSLVRAGLASSHRGVQGGFELSRPGAEINLLQIVEATDGPIQLEARFTIPAGERLPESVAADEVWRQAATAMTDVLRNASLAELVQLASREYAPALDVPLEQTSASSRTYIAAPRPMPYPVELAAAQ